MGSVLAYDDRGRVTQRTAGPAHAATGRINQWAEHECTRPRRAMRTGWARPCRTVIDPAVTNPAAAVGRTTAAVPR
jgi:hypothetical protein